MQQRGTIVVQERNAINSWFSFKSVKSKRKHKPSGANIPRLTYEFDRYAHLPLKAMTTNHIPSLSDHQSHGSVRAGKVKMCSWNQLMTIRRGFVVTGWEGGGIRRPSRQYEQDSFVDVTEYFRTKIIVNEYRCWEVSEGAVRKNSARLSSACRWVASKIYINFDQDFDETDHWAVTWE